MKILDKMAEKELKKFKEHPELNKEGMKVGDFLKIIGPIFVISIFLIIYAIYSILGINFHGVDFN